MNRFQITAAAAIVAIAAVSLGGCGGGGGSVVAGGGANTSSSDSTVTVSPSLGKFSAGAHVTIKKPDGTTIATADTTLSGTASVNVGSYSGPLVIEVTGGTGVTYYDEGANTNQPFGANDFLRAIAPSVQTNVGVTTATHAAVEAIKTANGGTIPVGITSGAISDANAKIAVALGIGDVLQAPKLVDGSTANTLDVANVNDKYALQLAALAKLAATGKTALDVANDIARDLSDDKLDGQVNGVAIPNRSTTYTVGSVVGDMSNNVKTQAAALATSNTNNLVNNDPTVVGIVTPDVTKVVAPSPAVLLAKAMFKELRMTFSSLANSSKTGFLDNQARALDVDIKASVAPTMSKVFGRINALNSALKVYDDSGFGVPNNGTYSGNLFPTLVNGVRYKIEGYINALYGNGHFQYCVAGSFAPGPVTCLLAAGTEALYFDPTTSTTSIKFIRIVVTPTSTANQFSYIATREIRNYDYNTGTFGAVLPDTVSACGNGCSGTITRTFSGSALTGIALTGTLPPSTMNASADTVNLSAIKSSLPTLNNYRYALNGSASSTDAAGLHPAALSFDNGSQIDFDDTNSATTGPKLVAVTIIGTIQTSRSKLTGSLSMSDITKDLTGVNTVPANMVFNGSITDTSTNGAGTFLTGKLESSVTGYGSFDSTKLLSDTNYVHGTATFTGTVQAPASPLLKLVISGSSTGANSSSVTLNYSYGTVSITGSGTSTPTGSSFTLSNQDGIQISANPDPLKPNQNVISKAGVTLASFINGVINYVDGSSETFN